MGAVAAIWWRKAKKKVADKLGIDENAKKATEADVVEDDDGGVAGSGGEGVRDFVELRVGILGAEGDDALVVGAVHPRFEIVALVELDLDALLGAEGLDFEHLLAVLHAVGKDDEGNGAAAGAEDFAHGLAAIHELALGGEGGGAGLARRGRAAGAGAIGAVVAVGPRARAEGAAEIGAGGGGTERAVLRRSDGGAVLLGAGLPRFSEAGARGTRGAVGAVVETVALLPWFAERAALAARRAVGAVVETVALLPRLAEGAALAARRAVGAAAEAVVAVALFPRFAEAALARGARGTVGAELVALPRFAEIGHGSETGLAGSGGTFAGLVAADAAAHDFGVVDLFDGELGLGAVGHFDEAEALGLAVGAAGDDAGGLDDAVFGEEGAELVVVHVVTQVADVDFDEAEILAGGAAGGLGAAAAAGAAAQDERKDDGDEHDGDEGETERMLLREGEKGGIHVGMRCGCGKGAPMGALRGVRFISLRSNRAWRAARGNSIGEVA